MIVATEKCGCPLKQINLTNTNRLKENNEFLLQDKSFDRVNRQLKIPEFCDSVKNSRGNSLKDEEKNVSEISGTNIPYKEIEAIINNNRMVLRIQKIPIEEKWDPPCDCMNEKQSANKFGNYSEDVMFRKVEDEEKPSSINQEEIIEPSGSAKRIITVVSHPESENGESEILQNSFNSEDDKNKRKNRRSMDFEENPNVFVLKIRRKSECSEGKENIDLEFRTPRPWQEKPKFLKVIKKAIVKETVLPLEMIEIDENIENKKEKKRNKGGKGKKKKK